MRSYAECDYLFCVFLTIVGCLFVVALLSAVAAALNEWSEWNVFGWWCGKWLWLSAIPLIRHNVQFGIA